MPGKRTNGGRSHSADTRPKPRLVSDKKLLEQYQWRKSCLELRQHLVGEFTKKNRAEAERLGVEILKFP